MLSLRLDGLEFQICELRRQGSVAALINERTVTHTTLNHSDPGKFHRFAKNLFLIDELLIWNLAAATMCTGGVYFNTSRSGIQRAHVVGYSDFVIGLNDNGDEARGLKIGLVKDRNGAVWVATVYPVEAGIGM